MVISTATVLSSCFGGGDKNPDESTPADNGGDLTSDSESQEENYTLNLVQGGKTEYVIIVPTKAKDFTNDTKLAVESLIRSFKNYTGAEITYKTDYMGYDENYNDIEPDPNALEILIGNTNRPESAEAIADLGFSEYAIKAVGKKLVINGTTEATINAAIEYFYRNIMQGNKNLSYGTTDGDFIFTTADNYVKKSSYQIKSITINDKKIATMSLVYPDGDKNAKYMASLIQSHIKTFSGNYLPIVSDAKFSFGPAILVGKTNISTVQAPAGKYLLEVTAKGLEISVNDVFSYAGVHAAVLNEVFRYSKAHIELKTGDRWEYDSRQEANAARTTDIRIMYQNMWGYMITEAMIAAGSLPNPVDAANVNRYQIANAVFDAYNPDVLCFQEMNTSRNTLESHLSSKGYAKVGGAHYDHHPVWYKTDLLKVVASGTNKGPNHYKSNWVVFEVLKGENAGEKFGVTNSHFTANSMVGGTTDEEKAELGDIARQADATALLKSVADAKAAGPAGMPIFTGGDYNCHTDSGAYAVLTEGGLVNVRDIAEKTAGISCHHGVPFDESNGNYKLPGAVQSSVMSAIDHIMILDSTKNAVDIKEYGVIGDTITAVSSDHAPHFVDFTIN